MIRRWLCAILMLMLVLGQVGCLPDDTASAADRSVTAVLQGPIDDLNPYSSSLTARRVGRLIFSGLTRMTPTGQLVPDLATEVPTTENGGISPDGRTVTFHLREDATWSDGEGVTSRDVVFTWGLLSDGTLIDQPGVDLSPIDDVQAPDAHTVVFRLSRPQSPLVWRVVPYVLPAHVLEGGGMDGLADYWSAPIGSGSYRVASFRPGVSVDLVSREGGEDLAVYFAASTVAARELFDAAGAAVWIDAPEIGPASPAESETATCTTDWYRFEFDLRGGRPVDDPVVRRAFALLVTRPASLSEDAGLDDPYGEPFSPPVEAATREAAALLDAAGWRRSGDGIRRKNGIDLTIHMITPPLASAEGRRMEALQAAAESVGIALDFAVGGYGIYGNAVEGNPLLVEDWDVVWRLLPVEHPAGYAWPFGSADVPTVTNWWGLNSAGVADKQLDEYLTRLEMSGSPEENDQIAAALAGYIRAQAIVVWDAPLRSSVLVKGVEGVRPSSVASEALAEAAGWTVPGDGTVEEAAE